MYNKPTDTGNSGIDVYAGCKKSYTGNSVTASNFLNILRGNSSGVTGGSGEVLKSGPNDHVFVNFVDHGATGLVAMPVGPYLYAKDLLDTLNYMQKHKMYNQLVFYMEACESGSMFENLPSDMNIYVTTAANPDESSWGTYCPPDDTVNGTSLDSCLGDLYSVNWMEDSDIRGHMKESLQDQYLIVQNDTTLSHVMQYGELTWTDEAIGEFQGNVTTTNKQHPFDRVLRSKNALPLSRTSATVSNSVSSRYATLASLTVRSAKGSVIAQKELEAEQYKIRVFAETFTLLDKYTNYYLKSNVFGNNNINASSSITGGSSWSATLPIHITQWDCYKRSNEILEVSLCGRYTDTTLKYARTIAHMCEITNGDVAWMGKMITQTCTNVVLNLDD